MITVSYQDDKDFAHECATELEAVYKNKFNSCFRDPIGDSVVFDYRVYDHDFLEISWDFAWGVRISYRCDDYNYTYREECRSFIVRFAKKHKFQKEWGGVTRYHNDLDNIRDIKKVFDAFLKEVKNVVVLPGDIAKPTEVDHKTFRGRKRRSVAEAILAGGFCDAG